MANTAVCLKLNTISKNLSTNFVSSERINDSCDTYNGFKATNMRGVTLPYYFRMEKISMDVDRQNNLNKINDIRHLKKDWNGYGAQEISFQVIKMSEEIIKSVCVQPVIFPTGRNSIQMQYELEDKSYLEFEVFEKKIVCMKVPRRIYEEATFQELNFSDMMRINQIVKEFYGK